MDFDIKNFFDNLPPELDKEALLSLVPADLWKNNPVKAAVTALRRTGKYDETKYLEKYHDVKASGMGALEHYVRHGLYEKRNMPCPGDKSQPAARARTKKKEKEEIRQVTVKEPSQQEEHQNIRQKTREEYYAELHLPGWKLDPKKLNIGFLLGGGMGDFLIFFNYLHYFCKKFKAEGIHIETIFDPNKKTADLFLVEGDLSDNIMDHPMTNTYFNKYDLFIQLSRYPDIRHRRLDKIKLFSPELLDYVLQCEKFKIQFPRHFVGTPTDGQSAAISELYGVKRIQQPDIYGLLGITEKYAYPLPIERDDVSYLHSQGLTENNYITLNRGGNLRFPQRAKLWPIDYYNQLIAMLKKEWPDKKIVQIGANYEHCGAMRGVDVDLVGGTDMLQVASLLAHSALHVDSEGGMVHLRHALQGGPSIVLFGPTSAKFFGYSDNYNITGKGCSHWCEWVTNSWLGTCPRGYGDSPCMLSIVPEIVLEQARLALNGHK